MEEQTVFCAGIWYRGRRCSIEINVAKEQKISKASSQISQSLFAFEEKKEPIVAAAKSMGFEPEDKKFFLKNFLSPREMRNWNRMSVRKKKRIVEQAKRTRDYRKFEESIKTKTKQIGENDLPNTHLSTPSKSQVRNVKGPAKVSKPVTNAGGAVTSLPVGGAGTTIAKTGFKAVKKIGSGVKKEMEKNNSSAVQDSPSSQEISSQVHQTTTMISGVVGAVVIAVQALIALLSPMFLAIIAVVVAIVMLLSTLFSAVASTQVKQASYQNLSSEVMRYEPTVKKFAEQYEIADYTGLLLAIMQVESGGRGADVMQSSESAGLPPGSLTTPEASIEQGVKYFSSLVGRGKAAGVDENTMIQSYNFGAEFIGFVQSRGCVFKQALAEEFARNKSSGVMVPYLNPIAANAGYKRYAYGNMFYVALVSAYYVRTAFADADLNTMFEEAKKYEGRKYVWGGANPQVGFDCSGLTQWCYGKIGIQLPHSAQMQYDMTEHIPLDQAQPGDLIFLQGTYSTTNYITHVEIYVGNGVSYGAGDPIGYHNLNDRWYQSHMVGAGRLRRN